MPNVSPIAKGKSAKPLGIVIGIGNQKGGVGKSTNTVHLAAALGEKGYRCLIVDLDPTAGSTKLLGIDPECFAGTLELVTDDNETPLALTITEGMPQGVSLVPARTDLNNLDAILGPMADRVRLLEDPLDVARKHYDYIFLDTPPSAGATLTVAAYASADWFLLSVFPEPLAIGGLSAALKDIQQARKRLNRSLEILGVIIAKVRRTTKLWVEVDNLVKESLPGRAFKTTISDAVAMSRLSGKGITLFQDRRLSNNKLANEYRNLVAEIELRTQNRSEFLQGRLTKRPKFIELEAANA